MFICLLSWLLLYSGKIRRILPFVWFEGQRMNDNKRTSKQKKTQKTLVMACITTNSKHFRNTNMTIVNFFSIDGSIKKR